MRGRPTKLTKAMAEAIVADVEAGLAIALAAEAAGVHRDSIYAWLRKGTEDALAGVPAGWPKEDGGVVSPERAFSDAIAGARAKYGRSLALDLASGEKDHRALAYLERTRLARYYSDKALEEEVLADRPEPTETTQQPGTVAVETVQCHRCGVGSATDDGTPAFCAGCGARLPTSYPAKSESR